MAFHVTVDREQPRDIRLGTGDRCDNCIGKVLGALEASGLPIPTTPLAPIRADVRRVIIAFQGKFLLCPACIDEIRK